MDSSSGVPLWMIGSDSPGIETAIASDSTTFLSPFRFRAEMTICVLLLIEVNTSRRSELISQRI